MIRPADVLPLTGRFVTERLAAIEKTIDSSMPVAFADGEESRYFGLEKEAEQVRAMVGEVLVPRYRDAGWEVRFENEYGYPCNQHIVICFPELEEEIDYQI